MMAADDGAGCLSAGVLLTTMSRPYFVNSAKVPLPSSRLQSKKKKSTKHIVLAGGTRKFSNVFREGNARRLCALQPRASRTCLHVLGPSLGRIQLVAPFVKMKRELHARLSKQKCVCAERRRGLTKVNVCVCARGCRVGIIARQLCVGGSRTYHHIRLLWSFGRVSNWTKTFFSLRCGLVYRPLETVLTCVALCRSHYFRALDSALRTCSPTDRCQGTFFFPSLYAE